MFLLTKKNIKQYLLEKKLIKRIDNPEITLLQGGNVNTIFRVKTQQKEFVVKQTLEEPQNKAVFLVPMTLDRRRGIYEIETMKLLHSVMDDPPIPKILFEDSENFIFVMTAVPSSAKLYQTELFEGKFHFDIAYALGKFTAELHSRTYCNKNVEVALSDSPGSDLRGVTIIPAFDKFPYHKKQFIAAYKKNLSNRFCLVDADITQKNILLHEGTFTKLDFETAHYGDPALDVGIVLAHFLLPAFVYPQWREQYFYCAELFWHSYQKNCTFQLPKKFFENMKNYMAMMMLGRIDSNVVLPWLEGHHDEIRQCAVSIFTNDFKNIDVLLKFTENYMVVRKIK